MVDKSIFSDESIRKFASEDEDIGFQIPMSELPHFAEDRPIEQLVSEINRLKQQIVELNDGSKADAKNEKSVRCIPLVNKSKEAAKEVSSLNVKFATSPSKIQIPVMLLVPDNVSIDDLVIMYTGDAFYKKIPQETHVIISKSREPKNGEYVLSDMGAHLHLYVYETHGTEFSTLYDEMMDRSHLATSVLGVVIGTVDIQLDI